MYTNGEKRNITCIHGHSEETLKALHFSCIRQSISIARHYKDTSLNTDYEKLVESIKMRFFDKQYHKRGYFYNPDTNLYTWVY